MTQKIDARPIMARFSEGEFAALDAWRRAQPEIRPLAHVVRALVRIGLRTVQGDLPEDRAA
jgi:hypothetical protein